MKYYCIEIQDEEAVTYGKHDGLVTKLMIQNNKAVLNEIAALEREIQRLQRKSTLLRFSQVCYSKAISTALKDRSGSLPMVIYFSSKHDSDMEVWDNTLMVNGRKMAEPMDYFMRFGMVLDKYDTARKSVTVSYLGEHVG